jgi:GTP pyrophosphokinase
VATQRAKTRVRQWIKAEERKQSKELGTRLLETELRKKGLSPAAIKSDNMTEVAKSFNFLSTDDMVVSIAYGKISALQAVNRLVGHEEEEKEEAVQPARPAKQKPAEDKGVTITGMSNILYQVAKCCYPIPGDNLAGFITRGKGVTIHRRNCPNLAKLAVDDQRLIDVQWNTSGDGRAQALLYVDTLDKPGVLANVSTVISGANINIHHLEAKSTQYGKSRISIIVEVRDRQQLNAITQKLSQVEGVLRILR